MARKLSTDNNMGNVNVIVNEDDKLSDEHYILSGDEFYELHFK